ncbi:hypothetical protein ElyMa_001500700 [Elysia marginata]|uniref:Uncharacterized protein n=1 Tax=Elysia marginata TaxID=1093978 RepID=A0AAV4J6Y3_9GAST|nr:hypothetical protein ElyMa_001500700 [Elysia marginata]
MYSPGGRLWSMLTQLTHDDEGHYDHQAADDASEEDQGCHPGRYRGPSLSSLIHHGKQGKRAGQVNKIFTNLYKLMDITIKSKIASVKFGQSNNTLQRQSQDTLASSRPSSKHNSEI